MTGAQVWRAETPERDYDLTDVALVYGVGAERTKTLTRLGIRTVHDLAAADPEVLAERSRSSGGLRLSAKSVTGWQHHARALRDGTPVWLTGERFDHQDFIALDLEYDSFRGHGEVWLIGALVQRDFRVVDVTQFLCEGTSELKRGLMDVVTLLKKHHDLPIVTWHGEAADMPELEAAAKARRVKMMHLVSHRHVDLYRLALRSVRLPIPGLDLKSFGEYLGIERRSQISSGFEATIRDLVAYNREDLEALRFAGEFLRAGRLAQS